LCGQHPLHVVHPIRQDGLKDSAEQCQSREGKGRNVKKRVSGEYVNVIPFEFQ